MELMTSSENKDINKRIILFRSCLITVIILLLFSGIVPVYSQKTSEAVSDTTITHSPQKATWMSAALPGLGQAYNKKYWKIPVIWAGLGGLGYSIHYNHSKYKTYSEAYLYRIDNDSTTIDSYPSFSSNYLQTLKNSYRRNMELSVVLTFALYAINIIDATVDAHLYDFDVSDDLSMTVKPVMISDYNGGIVTYNPGIKITFTAFNNSKNRKQPVKRTYF